MAHWRDLCNEDIVIQPESPDYCPGQSLMFLRFVQQTLSKRVRQPTFVSQK